MVIGGSVIVVSFHCTTTTSSHTWVTILPNKDMISDIRPEQATSSTKRMNATLAMNGTIVYCTATNASGIVTSTMATLTVLGKNILMIVYSYLPCMHLFWSTLTLV